MIAGREPHLNCLKRRLVAIVLAAFLLGSLQGCGDRDNPSTRIRLVTSTSTENSGLLAELLPAFEKHAGIQVHMLAMGTGQALATGTRGDCDVLLVHAPEAEIAFVADGHGVRRHPVMFNDFVLVGPQSDPAGIRGLDAADALKRIAEHGARFISRGDNSGTHMKERTLWRKAKLDPTIASKGYREGGKGMGATLSHANERQAYALSDRGTFLAFQDKIDLVVLVEGDTQLNNPYSAIAINPLKHPHVNATGANAFIAWVTGEDGQRLIGAFRSKGNVLFHPRASR